MGGEVIRCQGIVFDDGEENLDLVQPTGVGRQVDRNQARPLSAEAIHCFLRVMARSIFHNPIDLTSGAITLLDHHVGDRKIIRRDTGFPHAASEELSAPNE